MAKNSTFVATLKFIDAFTPGFTKAIASAERANQRFTNMTRSMSNLGGALQRTGAVMTATVTAPLVMLGKKAMDSASTYEGALNQVMTLQRKFATNGDIDLSNPNSLQVFKDNVEKQITDMSKSYGIARAELANSYYILASAFNDTSHMQEALDVSNKMAIAGQVEAGESAKLLATFYNAYGDEMYNSVDKIGDIMASTVMYGFTTFPELASSMGQVVPMAKQAGMSIEDLATSMAVITSTGVDTAIATTYLRNALQNVIKTGDRKNISDDSFLQYLETLKTEMPEVEQVMDKFKNIRGAMGMNALLGNKDLYETYHNEIVNANDTLNEMYETISGSASHSMRQSMVSINTLLEKIGTRILPIVSRILEKIADYVDKLSDEDIDNIVNGLMKVAAAGPALSIAGTAVKGISTGLQLISNIKTLTGLKDAATIFSSIPNSFLINGANTAATTAATAAATNATGSLATDAAIGSTIAKTVGAKAAISTGAVYVAGALATKEIADYVIEKQQADGTFNWDIGNNYKGVPIANASQLGRPPQNASGTSRWKGGITSINENGGEIVDLPTGSRIYPHNQSMKMGGLTINIPKFADTITIRDDKDIDIFAEAFADKLMKVVANS